MLSVSVRWRTLFWLFVIVLIAYFDRVNFSIAAPLLMKEFGLGAAQLGLIMSAFTIGYTILNFPAGFIVEKYSASRSLAVIIALWSVMTVLTGFAWSFASLMVLRIVFGMCEGPMPPANTKIVNMWMLPKERATASGLWIAAIPAGVIIGNLVSSVIVTNWGWRSVFYLFGVVGVVVAFITWKVLRDRPEEHPSITREELNLIQSSIPAQASGAKGSGLWGLLRNPWVWVFSIVYFAISMVLWGNLNWLPTYFIKARGSSLLKSGVLASVPWIAAFFGPLVLGWISDKTGGKKRSLWLAGALFIMVPAIMLAITTPSLNLCLAGFAATSFLAFGAYSLIYALPMEIFDRRDVAKVTGIMLAWGSFAGVIAPSLIGYVLQETNSFNIAYYIFSAVSFLGGCLALVLLSKERSVHRLMEAAAVPTAAKGS